MAAGDDPRVQGYYTLASGALGFDTIPDEWSKRLPQHHIPAVHLGRLAVDESRLGQGLGGDLLFHALLTAAKISEHVGVSAVDVFAINAQAATWGVLYQFREVAAYRNTFDVIGTDPYPIGRNPASMAAEWTAETFRQVELARPMWQVPQLHNWANYAKSEPEKRRGRTPSVDEVRSMAWQCVCEGATGLVFYSWYDVKRNPDVPFDVQWVGLKQIAAEIDRTSPILLSVDPTPVVKIVGQQPRWLHWLTRSHAGKLYIVAVNDGDGSGRVVFRLPQPPRSIQVLGESRAVQPNGTDLEDDSAQLAVHVYEIEL